MAPVTASGMLSPAPQPPDGNGARAAARNCRITGTRSIGRS